MHFYLSAIAFVFIFIETTFQGGRTAAVYCIVLAVAVYVLYHVQTKGANPLFINRKSIFILFSSGFALVTLLFGVFPALRNPDLLEGVELFIDYHHSGAELSSTVAKVVSHNQAYNGLLGLSFGSTYITAPLVKFTYYIDELKVYSWHRMGGRGFK